MTQRISGDCSLNKLFEHAREWQNTPTAELNPEQVAVLNLMNCIQNRPIQKAGGGGTRSQFQIEVSKKAFFDATNRSVPGGMDYEAGELE